MRRTPGCKAYQQSDQMYCPKCVLVWDMNDPEPPGCDIKKQSAFSPINTTKRVKNYLRRILEHT